MKRNKTIFSLLSSKGWQGSLNLIQRRKTLHSNQLYSTWLALCPMLLGAEGLSKYIQTFSQDINLTVYSLKNCIIFYSANTLFMRMGEVVEMGPQNYVLSNWEICTILTGCSRLFHLLWKSAFEIRACNWARTLTSGIPWIKSNSLNLFFSVGSCEDWATNASFGIK